MSYTINYSACTQCRVCEAICPCGIIGKNPDGTVSFIAERVPLCMECGHCMAVCATGAITAGNLSYDKDFAELSVHREDYNSIINFLRHRRSVRFFKDQPVEKEVIQKIIDALALAPFGVNPRHVQVTVVADREKIHAAVPNMAETYRKLTVLFSNPLWRVFLKWMMPAETYNTVRNFIIPHTRSGMYIRAADHDDIARNAPALLLFHAHRGAEEHVIDSHIALTYAFLTAHALGLGATVSGLIPPAINNHKRLRAMFEIPAGHEVTTALILGYPKYKFKRAIIRPRTHVHWL